MVALEDCGADVGGADAGFAAGVAALLAGARVPVVLLAEPPGRLDARWRLARVVRSARPSESRALLWLLLALLVLQRRVAVAAEALLLLRALRCDARAALLFALLARGAPLWALHLGLPRAAGLSPHAALANSGGAPPLRRLRARRALARQCGVALLFQYWPLCARAPLRTAELVSLGAALPLGAEEALAELGAAWCEGALAEDEEVLALDPPGDAAAPLPASLALLSPQNRRDLDLLGYAGILGRFEGAGRRQTSYLTRCCPLLSVEEKNKLVALCTFTK